MQQLYGGMEAFKAEILQQQHNTTSELAHSIASLSSDVRSLSTVVSSMQQQLSRVDDGVANLTKFVSDIDMVVEYTTEQPITTTVTDSHRPCANCTRRGERKYLWRRSLATTFAARIYKAMAVFKCTRELLLFYDVASVSEITSCNKYTLLYIIVT